MAYEKIIIIGNVGKVEPLESRAGNPYLRMSVAVDRNVGGAVSPVWYSVMMFGSMVRDMDSLLKRYRPGRLLLVEGRPQNEAFVRADGTAGIEQTIVATGMPELLDSNRQNNNPAR